LKKNIGFFVAFLMFFSIVCFNVAFAKDNVVSVDSIVLEKKWDEMGIPIEKQKGLKYKLEHGQLLDSQKPENVKDAMNSLVVNEENPKAEYIFEDGSKIIVSAEVIATERISVEENYYVGLSDMVMPMATIEHKIVRLKSNDSVLDCSYWADFYVNVDYPSSWINRVYDDYVKVLVGTFQNKSLTIINKYETSSSPAKSELYFDYTIYFNGSPIQSGNARLLLLINNGNWYADFNYA